MGLLKKRGRQDPIRRQAGCIKFISFPKIFYFLFFQVYVCVTQLFTWVKRLLQPIKIKSFIPFDFKLLQNHTIGQFVFEFFSLIISPLFPYHLSLISPSPFSHISLISPSPFSLSHSSLSHFSLLSPTLPPQIHPSIYPFSPSREGGRGGRKKPPQKKGGVVQRR